MTMIGEVTWPVHTGENPIDFLYHYEALEDLMILGGKCRRYWE